MGHLAHPARPLRHPHPVRRKGVAMKSSTTGLLSGIALTAASMYLFDSTSGRRRRARLRDWLGSAALKAGRGLNAAGRDLSNRTRGIAAKTRLAFGDSP